MVFRLTREGSTADEPSNIALTDYSSLSSAELSTTEEVNRAYRRPPA